MTRLSFLFVLSLLLVLFNGTYVYALTEADLVSYWDCDEAGGVRYDEVHSNDNDLTDNNTVLYDTGKIGTYACDFESATQEYLSRPNADLTNDILGDMSVSFWVKLESLKDVAFIGKRKDTPSGSMGWTIMYTYADDRLYAVFSSNGTTETWTKYVTWNPSTATWYHLGFAYDDAGTLQFYENGVALGSQQTSMPTSIYDTTEPLKIGTTNINDGLMDGLLDEISWWKATLTADDFSELYNSGNGLAYADLFDTGTTTSTTTTATTTSDIDIDTLQWTIELYLSMFSFLIFTYLGYRFTKFFI